MRGIELLTLTTVGARSGRLRQTVLAFMPYREDLVVVASNYGSPAHPGWYHNLIAQPVVTVDVSGERFRCRARIADGGERDLLYTRLAEGMPGFVAAQGRTRRQIPIVVLERIAASSQGGLFQYACEGSRVLTF